MRGPGVRQDEGIPTLAGPGEQWGPSRALARLHNARESTGAGRRAGAAAGASGLLAWSAPTAAYITEAAGAGTRRAAPRAQAARNPPPGRGFGRGAAR